VGSLSAFQGGAEVCPTVPAGLQPVLVCYLEAAEGGKSPGPELSHHRFILRHSLLS